MGASPPGPQLPLTSLVPFAPPAASRRDVLWEDCRNSLGIARLLVQERRPEALLATACRMAVDSACRAALDQRGIAYDGDLEGGLTRLGAPLGLAAGAEARGAERLAEAERAVGWVAGRLRSEAPERSWSF
jgi:hypothetical protein